MRFTLLTLAALLGGAISVPADLAPRALATSCNRDNVYRSFINPANSVCASAFCSAFIASPYPRVTSGLTITTKTEIRTIATTTTLPPRRAKRQAGPLCTTSFRVDLQFYGSSRISSGCSCILTAAGSTSISYTTTVPSSTRTITTRTTTTEVFLPPATRVCALRGYATDNPKNTYSGGTGPGQTPELCQQYCLRAAPEFGCGTIGYNETETTCRLYEGSATYNSFRLDAGSPVVFYDNACNVP